MVNILRTSHLGGIMNQWREVSYLMWFKDVYNNRQISYNVEERIEGVLTSIVDGKGATIRFRNDAFEVEKNEE